MAVGDTCALEGDYETARELLQNLIERQHHLAFELQLAELDLDANRDDAAIDRLAGLYHSFPGNHAISTWYARALLKDRDQAKAETAAVVLRQQLLQQVADEEVLLARLAHDGRRIDRVTPVSHRFHVEDGVVVLQRVVPVVIAEGAFRAALARWDVADQRELGLGDESDGIMELPADAPVGSPLVEFLHLPDAIIDVDLTPNRGDCFSILGVARDIAALTGDELRKPEFASPEVSIDDTHPVELVEPAGCPRFAGRVVRGVDLTARSPLWMVERLRRAGLREIHPVVDVTNYVMLELGQPMHAFDLARLSGAIEVRYARAGEQLAEHGDLGEQRDGHHRQQR